MKKIWILIAFISLLGMHCSKTYTVARPAKMDLVQKSFAASANDLYYALRWAFKSSGYPIAEEDFQNGILRTRYVPVKAKSHYIAVFNRRDFGETGAYHQLEARLIPRGGRTVLHLGSRVQGIVMNIRSTQQEENRILKMVSAYLRNPNVQVTNQGVQE